ncbi:MAG: choice-of-anchor L domain-containing protein, partial [Burkholderiales bacterium]
FAFIANVNPGVQNELILAIADTSDGRLDSAAFIQAGTFAVCGGPGQPPCGGGGTPTGVPEPGSLALLGISLIGLGMTRKRNKISP